MVIMCKRALAIGGLFVTIVCLLAAAERFEVVHSGFEAFRAGEFGGGGENVYVSRSGRVQLIHRWDLNDDGLYDFVFSNTHNRNESPDAFAYLQGDDGFRSAVPPLHDLLPLYERWKLQERTEGLLLRLKAVGSSASIVRDLNNDGFVDIVLANRANGFDFPAPSYVYYGAAAGPMRRIELPTSAASDVAAADVNGDGYVDLLFSCKGRGSIAGGGYRDHLASYLYWGGAAGFSTDNCTEIATVLAESCAIGDLDGDGYLELVFAETTSAGSHATIYRGQPAGPDFSRSRSMAIPGLRRVRIQEVKPFGFVLVAVTAENVMLYDASLDEPRVKLHILGGGSAIAAGDLDGDKLDELVIATDVGATILWGREGLSGNRADKLVGQSTSDVAITDLNGDGLQEIVLAQHHTDKAYDASSLIYWGNQWGYGNHRRQELQTFGASSVTVGDVNNDGRPDLLFTNTVSANVGGPENREDSLVYWGVAHRGYSPSFVSRYPTNAAMGSALADLDDDGSPELLLANMDDTSFIYRGAKAGPLRDNPQLLTFPGSNPHNSFAVADLDRDGFLDVVLSGWVRGDTGGAVVVMRGGPTGVSSERSQRIGYDLRGVANIRLADLNADGWLDLFLAAGYDTRSAVLWGSREGFSMQRATFIDEPNLVNVDFADLDADGRLDLLLLRGLDLAAHNVRTGASLRIRFGDEKGFPGRDVVELPVTGALDVLAGDLNGDGLLDVAVAQYNGGTRSDLPFLLFWNAGKRRFLLENRTELPGFGGNGLLAGDFDYDGFVDLLAVNHIANGNHNVDSHLYWGSVAGFSARDRNSLPSFGPHWAGHLDIGNLLTRRPEEHYDSPPITIPAGVRRVRISTDGAMPHGSALGIEARNASGQDELRRSSWVQPVNGLIELDPGENLLQYRVILTAGRGGATPYLTGVSLREE